LNAYVVLRKGREIKFFGIFTFSFERISFVSPGSISKSSSSKSYPLELILFGSIDSIKSLLDISLSVSAVIFKLEKEGF